MQTHLTVNGTDMTDYIVDGSYNVKTVDAYESWKDGYLVEHRVIVSSKVEGEFSILCSDKTISLADFLTAWNAAVSNGVATIGLYIPTSNSFEAIECYFEINNPEHIKRTDDTFVDVLTITVKER